MVLSTRRLLEIHGFGSHAKVVRLAVANPTGLEEVRRLLPLKGTTIEEYEVDKVNGTVRITAQVRLKPDHVAVLLGSLQANEKIKTIELQ